MVKVETVVANVKVEKVGEIKVIEGTYRRGSYSIQGQVKVGNQTYELYRNGEGQLYAKNLDYKLLADMGIEVDFSDLQKEIDGRIATMEAERMNLVYASRNAKYDNYARFQMQLQAAGIKVDMSTREHYVKNGYDISFDINYTFKNKNARWSISIDNGRYILAKRFGDYKIVSRCGKLINLINKINDQKQIFESSINYEIAQNQRKNNAEEIMRKELNAVVEDKSSYDEKYRIGKDYDKRISFSIGSYDAEKGIVKYDVAGLPRLTAEQFNKIIEIAGLSK